MTQREAEQMMEQAREAQRGWGTLSVKDRCKRLGRLRRAIAADCEQIAETIAQEASKPFLDALSGDVMVALEMMRYYESHAPKILRSHRVGKSPFLFRGTGFETHFEPHGVALILGPSNYPFQLTVVPTITALAAGNAVVLKVSEHTPAVADLIARLCTQAGLPEGLVQVAHGGPEESGALIDAGPELVFFTGSSKNGRLVAERAARRLIPVVLELGGKDAALVFAGCRLERAVEGVAYGAFANAGRVCVGIKRAIVEEPIYEQFVRLLQNRIAGLTVGAGRDADLCPLPDRELVLLREQIEDALARGATLRWPLDGSDLGRTPVLLTGVPSGSRLLTEETFGPVLCVAAFSTEEEALALANVTDFALSGSVWTRDIARGSRIARAVSGGTCAVNDVIRTIANPYAPFGGNGRSGYGRYHGPEGLRAFSRTKTVMTCNGRSVREVHWFPFTAQKSKQLAFLLRLRHGGKGAMLRLVRKLLPMWLGAACLIPVAAQARSGAHVYLDVQLTPNAHGELAYLVFNSADGFPGDAAKAVRRGFVPIVHGSDHVQIGLDLPPGTYAISVYEDLNSNHKLDHNLLGIPREPVGASNNPRTRMGPPHFKDCSFRLGNKAEKIKISVVQGL